MRLRCEICSNSTNMPVSNQGNQKIKTQFVPATRFFVIWSHPEIYECFCVQYFKTIDEAKAHKKAVYQDYQK